MNTDEQLNLFEKQRRPATSYPKHEWSHPTKTWQQHWWDTRGVGWLGDDWIEHDGSTFVTPLRGD